MLKIALGLILGLTISAAAQTAFYRERPGDTSGPALPGMEIGDVYMLAGGLVEKGQSHAIRVDTQGRVYCSPHDLPEGK